jgi:hypothetical protein
MLEDFILQNAEGQPPIDNAGLALVICASLEAIERQHGDVIALEIARALIAGPVRYFLSTNRPIDASRLVDDLSEAPIEVFKIRLAEGASEHSRPN